MPITARNALGLCVEVDLTDAAGAFLDRIAAAYDDDPDGIGDLLQRLAQCNRTATRPDAGDLARDHAAAQADYLRQELADALPAEPVVAQLNTAEARVLAAQLAAAADGTPTARRNRAA